MATQGENNNDKKVVFKHCAPFTDCISEINNTQVNNTKEVDIVMPRYNLIEYSNNYLKTSANLWQYCRDKPSQNNYDGNVAGFNEANVTTHSFKLKEKISVKIDNNGAKHAQIMVPLKYLSNF